MRANNVRKPPRKFGNLFGVFRSRGHYKPTPQRAAAVGVIRKRKWSNSRNEEFGAACQNMSSFCEEYNINTEKDDAEQLKSFIGNDAKKEKEGAADAEKEPMLDNQDVKHEEKEDVQVDGKTGNQLYPSFKIDYFEPQDKGHNKKHRGFLNTLLSIINAFFM